MSNQEDDTVEELSRVYRAIESVRRSMTDWEVPPEAFRGFVEKAHAAQFDENGVFSRELGTAGAIEPFLSWQAFTEFFRRLESRPEFENAVLFIYRHDYHGPHEPGFIDSLADFDVSPFGTEYNVTTIDTIVVPVSYFRDRQHELLTVLHYISRRFCLIYIHQDDPTLRISLDELTDWFGEEERMYTSVMPERIDGFYRMEMPTGPDSWG